MTSLIYTIFKNPILSYLCLHIFLIQELIAINYFSRPNQISIYKIKHHFSNRGFEFKKHKRHVDEVYDDDSDYNDIFKPVNQVNVAKRKSNKYDTSRNKRIFYSASWNPLINLGRNDWTQDQKNSREMSDSKKDSDGEIPNLQNFNYLNTRYPYPNNKLIPAFPQLFFSSNWGPGGKRRRKRSVDTYYIYNKDVPRENLELLENHKFLEIKGKNNNDGVSIIVFPVPFHSNDLVNLELNDNILDQKYTEIGNKNSNSFEYYLYNQNDTDNNTYFDINIPDRDPNFDKEQYVNSDKRRIIRKKFKSNKNKEKLANYHNYGMSPRQMQAKSLATLAYLQMLHSWSDQYNRRHAGLNSYKKNKK
ncbi:unnamed protein product [Gordionus sp. m RMFG-2023]